MNLETKTAFAKRIGRDKSWVTRAAQADRLVLHGQGRRARVVVEASLERLEATRGTRYDMSAHWDEQRRANGGGEDGVDAAPASGIGTDEITRRTRLAQMRKEEAEADKRHRELEELTGALVRRADVERALADAVALVLGQIENMPDRIAPQIQGITDMERIRARIQDEMEGLCRRVSDEFGRLADEGKSRAA